MVLVFQGDYMSFLCYWYFSITHSFISRSSSLVGGRGSLRRFQIVFFEFAMMPAQEALGQDFAAVPVLVLFRRHAEGAGKSEATVAGIVAIVHSFLDTDDLQPSYHHRGDTSVYTEYGHAQIRSWDGIYPSVLVQCQQWSQRQTWMICFSTGFTPWHGMMQWFAMRGLVWGLGSLLQQMTGCTGWDPGDRLSLDIRDSSDWLCNSMYSGSLVRAAARRAWRGCVVSLGQCFWQIHV